MPNRFTARIQLLILILLTPAFQSFSQNAYLSKKIDIDLKNVSQAKALSEIEIRG